MRTVTLGKTGLQVSRVGMGGIPIQRPPFEEAVRVLQRGLDLGINFIDTAIGYGDSEERVGRAIAGRRDQVIVATKGGWQNKSMAQQHIGYSLMRLNTDYIDLWQFHSVGSSEAYEMILGPGGAMEAAQEAQQAGKIRHIGISSHSLDVALKAVASGHFETIQFPMNLVSNEAVDELVPLAREHDVGFIGMKPFAGGRLSDASLAIKYVLQFDNVVPDPGVEKVEQVEEIVELVNNGPWALTAQEQQRIEAIRAELGTRFCRQCGYCMPCPQGVNIPMVMITQIMWTLWPRELFQDPGWWFAQAVETAGNCAECGECEEKCPYQLPIREMMVENVAFFDRVRSQ